MGEQYVLELPAPAARLEQHIKPSEDYVLIIDIGPAEAVEPRVESLGKTFEVMQRQIVVI